MSRVLDKRLKSAFEWKLIVIPNFWFVVKMELRVHLSSVFLQGGIKQSDPRLPHWSRHQRKNCPLLHSSESHPGVLLQPVLLVLFLTLVIHTASLCFSFTCL